MPFKKPLKQQAGQDREGDNAQSEELEQPGEHLLGEESSIGLVETQKVRLFEGQEKLNLECGQVLGPIEVAYETYGQLNEGRDNAILLLHALSGDAHVAGKHSVEDRKGGWWDIMVGPGKGFDTDKYFVICANCLGGCMGTTGPSSINPETGRHYGLDFPMITVGDMVEVQRRLMDYLGIERLLAVAGGSMGGMQALEWATRYPERVAAVFPIATTARLGAQGIAFDAVGRNAILRDENFREGTYYERGKYPHAGLAVARMVGHITYLSDESMHEKFGRRLERAQDYKYDFESEFSVETYLDHQGSIFVDRFDANTYLYFSKAMDYFDLPRQYGDLTKAMERARSRFLVISFSSDWLFPARQSREIVNALLEAGQDVSYCNIDCPYGHDSFLLESKVQGALLRGFLAETQARLQGRGVEKVKRVVEEITQEQQVSGKATGSIFSGGRVDHRKIAQLIEPDSSVLDLGCGDGQLLMLLRAEKNIRGLGLTLGERDAQKCVERGVNVVQYDLEKDLGVFADNSFDYVVLSQTLQVIRRPAVVLREMLRIGRQGIVSFPNFAYWRGRVQMMFKGRAPVFESLPYQWYDKPSESSINYMSLSDFEEFVRRELGARLVKRIPLSSRNGREVKILPNWRADEAIFVIANGSHE